MKKIWYARLNTFIEKFKNINGKSNVFFIMDMPGAGEPSYFFEYLNIIFGYLKHKQCNLYIVTNYSYCYVTKLYTKYYNIKYLFYNKSITKQIRKFIKDKNGTVIENIRYPGTDDLFFLDPNERSVYSSLSTIKKCMIKALGDYRNQSICYTYKFDSKIDYNKMDNIIKFIKGEKIILCNFESKCGNIVNEYKINFRDILKHLITNKKQKNLLINSVYDKQNYGQNGNVMVNKLTFQEIIYLLEKGYVERFISYRNGINDMIFIFYPKVNQVIYYPDEYMGNVSKNDYSKYKKEEINLKCDWVHRWGFPQNHAIKQYLKNDFRTTIDSYV